MKLPFGITKNYYKQKTLFRSLNIKRLLNSSNEHVHASIDEHCLRNINVLLETVTYCANHNISGFRPPLLFTYSWHPAIQYDIKELPSYKKIKEISSTIKKLCKEHNIRITFQIPTKFCLGSKIQSTIDNTIKEIEAYIILQQVLELEDYIVLGIGDTYNDKAGTIERTKVIYNSLDSSIQKLLAFTNNIHYSANEVIQMCADIKAPFVFNSLYDDYESITEDSKKYIQDKSVWNKFDPLIRVTAKDGNGLIKNKFEQSDVAESLFMPKQDAQFLFELESHFKEKGFENINFYGYYI